MSEGIQWPRATDSGLTTVRSNNLRSNYINASNVMSDMFDARKAGDTRAEIQSTQLASLHGKLHF